MPNLVLPLDCFVCVCVCVRACMYVGDVQFAVAIRLWYNRLYIYIDLCIYTQGCFKLLIFQFQRHFQYPAFVVSSAYSCWFLRLICVWNVTSYLPVSVGRKAGVSHADAEVPSALLSCLGPCSCGSSPGFSQLVGGSRVPVLTGLGSAGRAGSRWVCPRVLRVALRSYTWLSHSTCVSSSDSVGKTLFWLSNGNLN